MRSTDPSPRQREAYDYIVAYIEEHGYAPALREIGEHMGIRSTNGVNDHLKALERKGYLSRDPTVSRAIRVLPPPRVLADASPLSLLQRAYALADAWTPSAAAELEVAADESWWMLALTEHGEANQALLAELEPEFKDECWRLSTRDGYHLYSWGRIPEIDGLSRVVAEHLQGGRPANGAMEDLQQVAQG